MLKIQYSWSSVLWVSYPWIQPTTDQKWAGKPPPESSTTHNLNLPHAEHRTKSAWVTCRHALLQPLCKYRLYINTTQFYKGTRILVSVGVLEPMPPTSHIQPIFNSSWNNLQNITSIHLLCFIPLLPLHTKPVSYWICPKLPLPPPIHCLHNNRFPIDTLQGLPTEFRINSKPF